jgi:transcriptional regulator with XRE-family HTH domain
LIPLAFSADWVKMSKPPCQAWRSCYLIGWRIRQLESGDIDNKEVEVEASFGKRLRDARELRKLNQVELAGKTGLPVSSISHFEGDARKPSFDTLRILAKELEVSTDYLLGLAASPEKSTTEDALFRHGNALSDEDRKFAAEFMKLLAKKGK